MVTGINTGRRLGRMLNGKHNYGGVRSLLSILFLVMSNCVEMSSASALPPIPFMEGIKKAVCPRVTVTVKNEARHKIYLECGFDEKNKRNLERLEPGEMRLWSFREILFPLRWCYVHINNHIRGAFWAFTVRLRCINCEWSIRDDGAYHLDGNLWVNHTLFLQ